MVAVKKKSAAAPEQPRKVVDRNMLELHSFLLFMDRLIWALNTENVH
jgi:hypothetical protein